MLVASVEFLFVFILKNSKAYNENNLNIPVTKNSISLHLYIDKQKHLQSNPKLYCTL